MKVITQLIRHFWQRGALTVEEIEYLLDHNFALSEDLPGYHPRSESFPGSTASDSVIDLPDRLEQIEEELVRRQPVRRRAESEPRPGQLRVADIRKRLRDEYHRRRIDLASVLALGKKLSTVDDWQQAASELRSVTANRFYHELCHELRDGDVLLGDIWQASDPEPFHHLITDSEARGRAARSFLALLVADGPDELGKYSWVLKYDEMQALINLRVLHQRLLANLRKLFGRDPLLLTHALARNSDPVQIWSLVILYNALRSPPVQVGEQPRFGKEYGPVFMPNLNIWKLAWTSALRMDRRKVIKLLIACHRQVYYSAEIDDLDADAESGLIETDSLVSSDQFVDASEFSYIPFMCPVGWHLPKIDGDSS